MLQPVEPFRTVCCLCDHICSTANLVLSYNLYLLEGDVLASSKVNVSLPDETGRNINDVLELCTSFKTYFTSVGCG